jgi:hypothetical protein
VLGACDQVLEAELRGVLLRDDDYASAGKPVCDYEDPQARKALIDALATDAHAILGVVDGKELSAAVGQAALVLAAVVAQGPRRGRRRAVSARQAGREGSSDLDRRPRRPAWPEDPCALFDGYKRHVALDPDCELITATAVTAAGNAGEG